MKRSFLMVSVLLAAMFGGCRPSDEEQASTAFNGFLAACRNGDYSAAAATLTGTAAEVLAPKIKTQPEGNKQFVEMFAGATLAPKRIDDKTVELSGASQREGRSMPIVVVMAKVGDDWKISDLRIGSDPGLRASAGRADSVRCGFQLKKIGLVLEQYATGNNGYPPTLNALVEKGLLSPGDLKCPAGARGYFYFPPTANARIFACDLAGNHGDSRSVLFRDGSVLQMTPAEFDKAMKEPAHAAFAKALAAVEAP